MLCLSHILEALNAQVPVSDADFPISGGCIDSRKAEEGNLFIALPGEFTDGHLYVDQAFDNGAYIALINNRVVSDYPIIDISNKDEVMPNEAPFSLLVDDTLTALNHRHLVASAIRHSHNWHYRQCW